MTILELLRCIFTAENLEQIESLHISLDFKPKEKLIESEILLERSGGLREGGQQSWIITEPLRSANVIYRQLRTMLSCTMGCFIDEAAIDKVDPCE